ncbi:hypothetical protein [Vibrio parahaemolyticus]|uniref:hypothetical protein n=1 Tax=Vibrio parahaemolyticus TaxID=670 RepID=UPI00044D6B19|nr:hypothetical protein [Vibrio parahaemolyticus]EXJ31407.1 putative transposase [Vibrio parahaemolyticus VPCR-2009]
MFGFRTKPDLGNKTRQHAYGLKKQLAQEPRNNNLSMLIGSVCPRKGIGEAIVVPWVHKDIIIEHLAVTEEGRHAVVVMDGAGWHTEEIANDFKMSVSSKFRPILQSQTLSNKYGVGCGNAI